MALNLAEIADEIERAWYENPRPSRYIKPQESEDDEDDE